MGYPYQDKRRGKQVWAIAYEDVDGRLRKERTKALNKTLAKRILAARQDLVERARLQGLRTVQDLLEPPKVETFRKFSAEYMEHSRANKSVKGSLRDICALKPLMKMFGKMSLRDINAGHVQRYIDKRLRTKSCLGGFVKPRTVCAELATLSAFFREAGKRELVDKNPVRGLKKPKADSEIVRYLDYEEEDALLSHAGSSLRPAIIAAIHSGLRDQELANLTWAQVKMRERTIIVRKAKSKRGRVVPMSDTLFEILDSLPRYIDSPYVFTNSKTRTRYDRFNNTTWRSALKKSGVEDFRWHDLRHTFASRLAQAGVPLKVIQELMGHSSVVVTMRYAHLAPDNRTSAVLVLDARPEKAPQAASSTTHYATHKAKMTKKTMKSRSLKRKMLTGS